MKLALTLLATLLASATANAQTVIEYVNQGDFPGSPNGQYFYTADPGEQAYVDSGAAGAFKRTGGQFPLGGADPVCRFYGSVTPGPNSHFYTVSTDECNSLKALQKTPRPTDAQQWNYEGSPLRASAPKRAADGTLSCAEGTNPVYRAYNNAFNAGGKNPWDSNHRFSARQADIEALIALGWKSDGLVMCVPAGATQTAQSAASSLLDQCAAPRTDARYGDKQGTLETEKAWVRAFVNDRYLWTEDAPNVALEEAATPTAYYAKRFNPFRTETGGKIDRFSASQNTASFEAGQSGTTGGYGWSLSALSTSPPRNYVVRYVEPNSPAAAAGVERGMRILTIDGVDLVSGSDLATLNAGFAPALGTTHSFVLQRADGSNATVTMTASNVSRNAAQTVTTFDTAKGRAGYLHYTTFNTFPSESQAIDAFTRFANEGVKELFLDLRYNGGGLIRISSQVAYMIAGGDSASKTFYQFTYNSKRTAETNAPGSLWKFFNTTSGASGSNTVPGTALPTLNLKRVYILTGSGTASASEGVINGLRGIGVEVILVGNTTLGKPYGSLPTENCGTTYSMLEFKGNNAVGFGDFPDGFTPACTVADDFSRALGNPAEARLAAAIAHASTGSCPAGTAFADTAKRGGLAADAPALVPEIGGAIDSANDRALRLKQALTQRSN